jgi:hypothetical protein
LLVVAEAVEVAVVQVAEEAAGFPRRQLHVPRHVQRHSHRRDPLLPHPDLQAAAKQVQKPHKQHHGRREDREPALDQAPVRRSGRLVEQSQEQAPRPAT